jgi:hypothetical protein
MSNVVQIKDYLPPPQKSQYELYPLPFFDAATLCTWNVKPTGNYGDDCKIGRQFAIDFLQSCDGTVGWSALLPAIVADMIRAGTNGAFADGHPKINGIVIGFVGTLGRVINHAVYEPAK